MKKGGTASRGPTVRSVTKLVTTPLGVCQLPSPTAAFYTGLLNVHDEDVHALGGVGIVSSGLNSAKSAGKWS